MPKIDVICPVYREEEVIELFHRSLAAVLDGLSHRYAFRILYVADPSPDGTEAALSAIAQQDARVEVLVLSRRFGHQIALVAGLDHSRGDAAIMLDSDLQHPPELIPELIEHWQAGGGTVRIVGEVVADSWSVTVSDSGPGIPADAVEMVFEPFFRLPRDERSDIEGNGLGLSICGPEQRITGCFRRALPQCSAKACASTTRFCGASSAGSATGLSTCPLRRSAALPVVRNTGQRPC